MIQKCSFCDQMTPAFIYFWSWLTHIKNRILTEQDYLAWRNRHNTSQDIAMVSTNTQDIQRKALSLKDALFLAKVSGLIAVSFLLYN